MVGGWGTAKPDLEKDFQLLSTLKAEIEKTKRLALAWDEAKDRFDARKRDIDDRLSVAVAAEVWDGAEKIKEEFLILPPTVEEFIDFEAEESRRERERKAREEEEQKLKSRTHCVKCNHHFNTLEVDEEWLKSINGVVEMAKQAMPMRFARVDNQKARSKKQKPTRADVNDNTTYNPPRKKRSRLTGCKQRAVRDALTHSSIYTTN